VFLVGVGLTSPATAQPDGVSLEDDTYTVSVSGSGDTDQAATLQARRRAIQKAVIARIGMETYKQHRSLIDEQIVQYPDEFITQQSLVDSDTSSDKVVSVELETQISKPKLDEQLASLALLDSDASESDPARQSTPDTDPGDASPGLMTDLGHRGESTGQTESSSETDNPDDQNTSDQQDSDPQQTNSSSANKAEPSPFARAFPTFDAELGIEVRGGIPSAADFTIPLSIGYDTGLWRVGLTAEFGAHRPNSAPSDDGTESDAGFGLGASLTRTLFRARPIGFGVRTRATLLYQQYEGECRAYAPVPGEEGPQCQSRLSENRRGGAVDLELSMFQDVPLAARVEGGLSLRGSTIYGAMVGGFLRASWGSTR
jgi:hypothetical protein